MGGNRNSKIKAVETVQGSKNTWARSLSDLRAKKKKADSGL